MSFGGNKQLFKEMRSKSKSEIVGNNEKNSIFKNYQTNRNKNSRDIYSILNYNYKDELRDIINNFEKKPKRKIIVKEPIVTKVNMIKFNQDKVLKTARNYKSFNFDIKSDSFLSPLNKKNKDLFSQKKKFDKYNTNINTEFDQSYFLTSVSKMNTKKKSPIKLNIPENSKDAYLFHKSKSKFEDFKQITLNNSSHIKRNQVSMDKILKENLKYKEKNKLLNDKVSQLYNYINLQENKNKEHEKVKQNKDDNKLELNEKECLIQYKERQLSKLKNKIIEILEKKEQRDEQVYKLKDLYFRLQFEVEEYKNKLKQKNDELLKSKQKTKNILQELNLLKLNYQILNKKFLKQKKTIQNFFSRNLTIKTNPQTDDINYDDIKIKYKNEKNIRINHSEPKLSKAKKNKHTIVSYYDNKMRNILIEESEHKNNESNDSSRIIEKKYEINFSDEVIDEYQNLYTLIGTKLIGFNLCKKKFILINPKDISNGILEKNINILQKLNLFPNIINTNTGFFILLNNYIFIYSHIDNIIDVLTELKNNHWKGGFIYNDNNLYIISGVDTLKCEKYSFISKSVFKLAPVNCYRINSSCCGVNEYIYTIFGKNSDNSIERLNIRNNKNWEIIKLKNIYVDNLQQFLSVNIDKENIIIFGGVYR